MLVKSKVIVIGGGAAGMMAAATAASRGIGTLLLEKNELLGKKLYLTGNGRCNVSNYCDIEHVVDNTPGNGSFLYSALYSFNQDNLRAILDEMGVPTKIEKGNRVFPISEKAADVVRALEGYMARNGVEVRLDCNADGIKVKRGRATGVYTNKGQFIEASSIIVSTGGLSYPTTGSTGDGYRWAEEAGHSIVELRPSLVAVETAERWVKDMQGLSLQNIKLTAYTLKGKKIKEQYGEMLFTHFGVSGPSILILSRFIYDYLKEGVKLKIDLKPDMDVMQLRAKMIETINNNQSKLLKNALKEILPQRIISILIKKAGISLRKFANQVSMEERLKLLEILKGLEMTVTGFRPVKEAIVTAGGVSTKEVDPYTMESRLVKGLFFAGEVLDIDALTGGFNLQIAFSTGYLAGINCR